jgi:small multidrug resistance family-3 protein
MSYVWFALAAVLEIAGCFMFWLWLRMDRSALWALPALAALALFAAALTRVDAAFAGRAYAAYAGIYVIASVIWLVMSERVKPSVFDLLGSGLCLGGTIVILLGNRAA